MSSKPSSRKPYAIVGAGNLVASVWKNGEPRGGWQYRFNLFRMQAKTGHISQFLRPNDLPNLVKLCYLLTTTLADDGCLEPTLCQQLHELAMQLDDIIPPTT